MSNLLRNQVRRCLKRNQAHSVGVVVGVAQGQVLSDELF